MIRLDTTNVKNRGFKDVSTVNGIIKRLLHGAKTLSVVMEMELGPKI